MDKKLVNIRTVVAIGIGSAIFFVLFRFVAIPSGIPNLNLNLACAVLAFFAAIFGPVAGFCIGLIGHTLTDLTWGGVWWSWVIADAVFGLIIGVMWKKFKIEEGAFGVKEIVYFNITQIAANVIAWVAIAPVLDILFFQEPASKVFLQGVAAALINSAVILILGTVLAAGYSKSRTKAGSLSADK